MKCSSGLAEPSVKVSVSIGFSSVSRRHALVIYDAKSFDDVI